MKSLFLFVFLCFALLFAQEDSVSIDDDISQETDAAFMTSDSYDELSNIEINMQSEQNNTIDVTQNTTVIVQNADDKKKKTDKIGLIVFLSVMSATLAIQEIRR